VTRRALAWASLVVGGLLLLLGLCSAVGFVVAPFANAADALAVNTAIASFGAVGGIYGALLLLVGAGLLKDRLRAPLALPSPVVFAMVFVAVVAVGQAVLLVGVGAAFLFPLWHILAAAMVPLAVLAYAGRRFATVSARALIAQFTWGGLITIALALLLELVILGALLVAAGVVFVVWFGPVRAQGIVEQLAANVERPEQVFAILQQEPLLLLLGGGVALLAFVVIVPLLEEALKSAGAAVLLVQSRQAPKSAALLWGLAAGAGFAFTETLLNAQGGATGAEGTLGLWSGVMLLRAGTALMHMAATGTAAVGWYLGLIERRRRRLVLLLVVAAVGHGLWNLLAVFLGGLSVVSLAQQGGSSLFAGLLALGVLLLLVLLIAVSLLWIRALVRWAAQPAR
jgi:hypothetical protein